MRGALFLVRFLVELAMFAAYAALGFVVPGVVLGVVAGAGAALLAAAAWGLFVSPKARYDLGRAGRLAVELLLFAGATAALVLAGQPATAFVFALVALGQRALLTVTGGVDLGQPDEFAKRRGSNS